MKSKKGYAILILFLLVGSSLLLHYNKTLSSPNATFMGGSVDGIKNYFTPWYHIKHDASYTWFEGMNYPYGEHPVFADAQPLFSNVLRFVSHNLVDISDYTVGILNFALFLSLFATAWLLYLIFRRLRVEAIFSALAAACITLLSPQLLKFTGHYALGYTFCIPLLWYLALRYFEAYAFKFSLYLALTVFLLAWVHPYYLMISAVFLSALWLCQLIFSYRDISWGQRIRAFSIQVLLPGLSFFILLKLTDPVTDRPANPYGFEEFIATWRTLFLPYAISWLSWFKQFQTEMEKSWEGVAYVGLTGGFMFLFFWWRNARRLLRRFLQKSNPRRRRAFVSLHPGLAMSVTAGLLVGLLACGFPFSIKPEIMTDLFPPIKQFRSLGRFAWVFYYTWSVYAFYLVYLAVRAHRHRGRRILAYLVMALPVLILYAEGYGMNHALAGRINRVKTPKIAHNGENSPWIAAIEPEKYSALIALPFFHEGSENFSAQSSETLPEAFEASIVTGLPLMNVMMSRTSLSQSWSSLQLTTEPYRPLEISEQMTDQRPVLALRTGTRKVYDGAYLAPAPPFVYEKGPVKLYSIDLNARAKTLLAQQQAMPDFVLAKIGYYFSDKGALLLAANRFEGDFNPETGDAEGYRGGKGQTLALKENNFVFQSSDHGLQAGDTLVLSVWVRLRGDRLGTTMFGFEGRNADDTENLIWSYPSMNKFIVAMGGDWALCEREIVVPPNMGRITVNITRWKRKPASIVIDNLMIWKKGARIFLLPNGPPVGVNNRYVPLAVPDSLKVGF